MGKKMSIFSFIFFILLIFSLSFYLMTGTQSNITLTGFLNFLSTSMNSIDVSWSFVDLTIYGDWGLFNFLKNFLNVFTSLFEVLIMLFGFIAKALAFVYNFVRGLLFP